MKNIKLIKYTVSLAILLLSACGKDFVTIDSQDKLTAEKFYNNETQIRAATASLYGFPWFNFNTNFFWLAGDCMSGNLYYTYTEAGQFFYFSFSDGNAYLSNGWTGLYRVVSYANSVINDMPRIASKNGVSQNIIDKAVGEARFIRASAYFMLAEFWGEVPIVENSTELVTSNNMILPKNTRSSVYEFMRRDLEYAAEHLPASDDKGRVTKWSAEGMLAKLYVTMAQNLGDPNSAAYFTKAKDYAYDVIANSGLQLMTDYYDLFLIDNDNNPESLFALQFMQGVYGIGNSRQANWARNSIITGNTEAWGGYTSATYDFVEDVEAGDVRRKAIYMQLGDHYAEICKKSGGYTYNIVSRDPADRTKIIEGVTAVLNSPKKYVVGSSDDTNGKATNNQATAINQYILRLADVYLIYAEAVLGAGSSTTDAKALDYFNTIRKRANLAAKSPVTFLDILKERRIEFGLESLFWFDIKRYYYRNPTEALAYLNGQKREYTYTRASNAPESTENMMEGYTLTPPSAPITIFKSQMFLPIPATEKLTNPKLKDDEPAVDYQFK